MSPNIHSFNEFLTLSLSLSANQSIIVVYDGLFKKEPPKYSSTSLIYFNISFNFAFSQLNLPPLDQSENFGSSPSSSFRRYFFIIFSSKSLSNEVTFSLYSFESCPINFLILYISSVNVFFLIINYFLYKY